MKKRDWLILGAALVVYLAARGPDLLGPFIFPFENAFQEAIALHHLPNLFFADRFLPVIARLDGQKFYHTAHPPLLHLLYAVLYLVLGVHEYVTRGFALLCFLGSFLIWRALLGRDTPNGWAIFAFGFFLPAPFILLTTTNYEPLSIFMVSLLAWLTLSRNAGLKALLPALTIGLLVDWPVYLAVPALLLLNWRDREKRRLLVILFAYETIFFFALQGYQYAVAGEAAFFSHAQTRANPLALFSFSTWRELFSHYLELTGLPFTILSFAVIIACLISWGGGGGAAPPPHDRSSSPSPLKFFAFFLALLLLSAPQLVSRHYVYLLYFSPLLAFAFFHALSRLSSPRMALLALLLLLAPRDYLLSLDRNPSYYAMASWLNTSSINSAFASSAVGTWYYYRHIETAHPVSAAMSAWLANHSPDLIHLDLTSGEVSQFSQLVGPTSDYQAWLVIPGEKVYVKKEIMQSMDYLLVEGEQSQGWQAPQSVVIMPGRERACRRGELTKDVWPSPCGVPVYAIREPVGRFGSSLLSHPPTGSIFFFVTPTIIHSLPFAKSDGVNFQIIREVKEAAGTGSQFSLDYARFLSEADDNTPFQTIGSFIVVWDAQNLNLITLPGPKFNSAFDDAYWVWPRLIMGQVGQEDLIHDQ